MQRRRKGERGRVVKRRVGKQVSWWGNEEENIAENDGGNDVGEEIMASGVVLAGEDSAFLGFISGAVFSGGPPQCLFGGCW